MLIMIENERLWVCTKGAVRGYYSVFIHFVDTPCTFWQYNDAGSILPYNHSYS